MPVWLRKHTYKLLENWHEKKAKQVEENLPLTGEALQEASLNKKLQKVPNYTAKIQQKK